jgi:tol-pal system protein YbgF
VRVMSRPLLGAAALAAAGALSACVPIERGRQMEARLQRLEVRGVEQQRTLDEQREVVRDRVAKVDKKIEELNQAARRSGADLGVQLTRLADELARVKGELEVAHHDLEQLEKAVSALDARTEGRFAALRGTGALAEHEAKQRLSTLPKGEEKTALLALARKEEQGGDKAVARELYEEYARRWPSDPKAAEARFRAGELLFAQQRWREALLAYGKVAEDFPRSDLAPEAMLGAAESMVALEMKDDARAVLEQLVERYPKAKAAAKAKERLDELAPPPPPPAAPAPKKKPAPRTAPKK